MRRLVDDDVIWCSGQYVQDSSVADEPASPWTHRKLTETHRAKLYSLRWTHKARPVAMHRRLHWAVASHVAIPALGRHVRLQLVLSCRKVLPSLARPRYASHHDASHPSTSTSLTHFDKNCRKQESALSLARRFSTWCCPQPRLWRLRR